MFDKKSRSVFKARVSRRNVRTVLSQMRRSGPQCIACDKYFEDSTSFEEHLQTSEHKMMDSPLELLLERISDTENQAPAYRNVRLQALDYGMDPENLDISSLPIGLDCIQSVQVSFCQVCSSFVPEDGQPDAVRRHFSSQEHLRKATLSPHEDVQ